MAYNPYAHVQDFLKGEQNDLHTLVEWNIHKNIHAQKDVKNLTIQHCFEHTWYVSHMGIPCIHLLFMGVI